MGGERPARTAESGGAMWFPKKKADPRNPGGHEMIEPSDRGERKRRPLMIDALEGDSR